MAKNKKIKYPVFVYSLIFGLALIAIAFFQPDFIFGQQFDPSVTGLEFIDVPIDPVTGGILGTIVLGAPDIVPFEQAGTMIGIPRVSSLFPRSPCTDNFLGADGISIVKPTEPLFREPNGANVFMPPDFGQRLSGERNQLDPIWWGSRDTGIPNTRDCAFAYAQWDIVDIPNDFVATSVALKLDVIQTRSIRNTNNPPQSCTITLQDFNIDTISDQGVMNKIWKVGSGGGEDPLVIVSGGWCNSSGPKSFQLGQSAVDFINDAISGGPFSQGVRSDKLLLGFMPTLLNNLGTGKNQISTQYWKTEGSLFLTGSSPPIRCDSGFNQVDFRCIPIICPDGERVDVDTNECAPIMCESNETLQGNLCVPLICQPGEEIVAGQCQIIVCPSGTELIGSSCEPLMCQEGFEISGNECILKQCSTGMELIGDNCQAIVCPTNTILVGNNCMERTCPAGQVSSNNECISETTLILCVDGFKQVGDECVPIDLDCPIGTEAFENVCVQRVPSLMLGSGLIDPNAFLISGLVIAGMSVIGIIIRRV